MNMINQKLLVIAPYPISDSRHGGQKRVSAIVENYRKLFETVKFVAIFHKVSYPSFSPDDIPLGARENLEAIDTNPLAVDQIIGKSINTDSHVRSFFAKMLLEYKPDIIHVEQVFLYDGLSVLLKELNMTPKLVYGSQNIEHKMKAAIYEDLSIDKSLASSLVADTKRLEVRFSREADLVIAVSDEDAEVHRTMGSRNVIVARNGIAPLQKIDVEVLSEYATLKKKKLIKHIITFIGSGHPPNYLGVLELIGDDTTFLPQASRLVLGGGVSEYFKTKFPKNNYPKLWKNLIATGMLTEARLTDLIRNTDIFILPITSGGGSNLKTAEAIQANRKIVATTYAFRGFEEYLSLPNIYIADDANTFKDVVIAALSEPFVQRSSAQEDLAKKVQWEYCLEPINLKITRLAERSSLKVLLRKAKGRARVIIRKLR